MQFKLCKPPQARRRYVHRRAFKSVYKFTPIQPPFVYFLTTAQTCAAYGISDETIAADRRSWSQDGTGNFAPPVLMDDHTFRYRWNSVTRAEPGNEFVDIFRSNRAAWIEADQLKSKSRTVSAGNNQ